MFEIDEPNGHMASVVTTSADCRPYLRDGHLSFSFMPSNNNTSGGGLFGQQQPASTGFGATSTGFSFGQNATSQPSGSLFSQPKPAFGAVTSPSAEGGLFGSKPAATPAYGVLNKGAISAFWATYTASPFGASATSGGGLFANNQSKAVFAIGTTSTFSNTGTAFNTGTSTGGGGGLFGNLNTNTGGGGLFSNTANRNKPAGGQTFNTGSTFNSGSNTLGGFGFNNTANKPSGFGTLGGGFGSSGTLGGGGGGGLLGYNNTVAAGLGENNIANLIKALTDNPFGHSSLLKTPASATGKADELLSLPASSNNAKLGSGNSGTPTYVLPSQKTFTLQPRPNFSIGDAGNLMNNRSLLFAGLDDT
ncbi:nucleoporin NUP145-like [Hyalella azteca]|uniref:Nucleoporin NUP145-like n=1 Tax=Hyalella azteca TaxID=294128 RepID=A0A8B7NRS7_HYAAZ|nr:nucleoporin NUP145-like [Hyalella azteca]